jgi:hypothetical protein
VIDTGTDIVANTGTFTVADAGTFIFTVTDAGTFTFTAADTGTFTFTFTAADTGTTLVSNAGATLMSNTVAAGAIIDTGTAGSNPYFIAGANDAARRMICPPVFVIAVFITAVFIGIVRQCRFKSRSGKYFLANNHIQLRVFKSVYLFRFIVGATHTTYPPIFIVYN